MPSILEVLSTAFGLVMDVAKLGLEHIKRYLRFVIHQAKLVGKIAVFTGIPVALCGLFGVPANWLYSGYLVLLTVGALYLLLLAWPLFFAMQFIINRFPELKENAMRTARLAGDIGFWGAMLAIYFYIVPVWKNPGSVPLLLLVMFALAMGTLTGRIVFNPKWVQTIRTVQLVGMMVLVTFSFVFPQTTRRLLVARSGVDDWVVKKLDTTQALPVTRFADIQFRDRTTGKALVWMNQSPEGTIALYTGEGFDAATGKPYRLIESPADIVTVSNYFTRIELVAAQKTQQEQAAQRREQEMAAQRAVDAAAKAEAARVAEEARRTEQARVAAEAERQRVARERTDFIARYRSTEPLRGKAPGQAVSVFVLTEAGQKHDPLGNALAQGLRRPDFTVAADYFKTPLAADGLAGQLLAGTRELADRLELAASLDGLLVGRLSTRYTTNEALNHLITAEVKLDVSVLSATSLGKVHSAEWTATGPGFKPEDARAAAEERLVKSLTGPALDAFRSTATSKLK